MTTKFPVTILELYLVDIFGINTAEASKEGLILEEISQSTKHQLKRLGAKLQEEGKSYIEGRNDLIKKYGSEVEENGQQVTKVTPENLEIFMKEVNELDSTFVQIDHHDFKESDFYSRNGKMFVSKNYYNLLDILIYGKLDTPLPKVTEVLAEEVK